MNNKIGINTEVLEDGEELVLLYLDGKSKEIEIVATEEKNYLIAETKEQLINLIKKNIKNPKTKIENIKEEYFEKI